MEVATSSRNQRSWVTTRSPPTFLGHLFFRCRASQAIPSTSRWLVGSSSMRTSHSPIKRAASPRRRRWPPESVPTRACQSRSPTRPAMTSRILGSEAHSCSAASPTSARPTVASASRASSCSSTPMRRPPRRVTRPSVGSSVPARIRKSDDFPPPFRPTTPILSPSPIPRAAESRTTLLGYSSRIACAPRR